jgi:hypothetical protein
MPSTALDTARKTALFGNVLTALMAWFCTQDGALPLCDLLRLCAANRECQQLLQGPLHVDFCPCHFVQHVSVRSEWIIKVSPGCFRDSVMQHSRSMMQLIDEVLGDAIWLAPWYQ